MPGKGEWNASYRKSSFRHFIPEEVRLAASWLKDFRKINSALHLKHRADSLQALVLRS
jgi:hypothetical protein